MSSPSQSSNDSRPLDLSKWRLVPLGLVVVGFGGIVLGFIAAMAGHYREEFIKQFCFSYLQAFMFFLSLGLGGLLLVILHHLFDASWSVPIRRICEHLACLLFPWLAILFIPIALHASFLYEWMRKISEHAKELAMGAKLPLDHSIMAKHPLFTYPGYYISAAVCFLSWWLISSGLRRWSLRQDETGSVECTRAMRRYAASGVFLFAVTTTIAAIMWMKALQYEWFSTMYGVWYFAGSTWLTIITVYVITRVLERQGPLQGLVSEKTYYYLGSVWFAFTVFYAYVTFAQYFIIWNANVPEETFWYVLREQGTWWYIGLIIIFGHFFVPFLMQLRIDWKLKLTVMVPMMLWAWLMHFTDMSFNIMPALHPGNFMLHWLDVACMALIGGILTMVFLRNLNKYPIMPQKDPRFAESQDIYVPAEPAREGGAH